MIDAKRIADKIVGMVADGRVTYPIIEQIGYWVAWSASNEARSKMVTLAHSIIANCAESEVHCNAIADQWKDLHGE